MEVLLAIVLIFIVLAGLILLWRWDSKKDHPVVYDERDMLYDAWVVIANSPGWATDKKWAEAAEQWRDKWHAYLDATHQ